MKRVVVALLLLVVLVVSPAVAAEKAAPTVSITSPEPGLTVTSDSVSVTAVYSAPEGAGVKLVELAVDGIVVQSASYDPAESSGLVTLTWEASGYLDGRHRLVMRVTDTTDRVAKAAIPVTLTRGLPDTQPLRISAPGPGAKVAGRIDVTADTADPSVVKYVIFLVDNVFKAMSNIRPFTYHWDTSGYLNGLHRLQAKAYLSDGREALSRPIEILVDNPSGATAMKPPAAPATPAAPKPAPVQAPARAAETALPAPVHTESATPFSKTVEVSKAEIGAPGTAPYVSPTGDLVQPPTTMLAARAGADSQLSVATVPDVAEAPAAPTAAAASVATPPVPAADPQRVSAESDVPSAPAADRPVAAKTAQAVAPVRVAALPAPASAMARTPAQNSPAAPAADLKPVGASRSAASPTALATPPAPKPTAIAAAATPKPITTSAAARPAPVALPAAKQIAMVPPKPVAAVAPAKPTPVAATVAAKPVVIAPAPKQIALLPPKPVAQKPAPKLTASPSPNTSTYVVQTGDCLYTIAAAHGLSPYQLAKANGLEAPYVVRIGQRLTIPESGIYINGKAVILSASLTAPDGREYQSVGLRQVVESIGGRVNWDPKTRQAQADARGHQVVVTIGDIKAIVDGKRVGMTMSAIIVFSRTLVPARFLGDAFDLAVTYDRGVTHIAAK